MELPRMFSPSFFFTLFLFSIHLLTSNANASLKLDLPSEHDTPDTISLHVTHQKCNGMKGLGYLLLTLFDGDDFHDLAPMNVYSPRKKSLHGASLPPKKRGSRSYNPRDYQPKKYETTYELPRSHFTNGDALLVSFLQEEIYFSAFDDKENKQMIFESEYFLWQACENIPVASLGLIPLDKEGVSLSCLSINITWEALMDKEPVITRLPHYKVPSQGIEKH